MFLVLSAILALGSIAWGWVRWRGQAPERSAWASVSDDLEMQSARIDSLKLVLTRMDRALDADKRAIASAGERLGHLGRQAVDGRDDREIKRVASVIGKCADAAFAKDDVVVALGHDVFGGEQEFVERRGHSAFEKHRFP